MCKILMPIKPEYVEQILLNRKKYEYRKTRAKNGKIDKMIIYSTSPVMKVVAEVEIIEIIETSPEELWQKTQKYSGIEKDFFDEYYKDKENAVAYKIGNINEYDEPKDLIDFGINYYPQSFVYID